MNNALVSYKAQPAYYHWAHLPFSKTMIQEALSCFDVRHTTNTYQDFVAAKTHQFIHFVLTSSEIAIPTLYIAKYTLPADQRWATFIQNPFKPAFHFLSGVASLQYLLDSYLRPFSRLMATETCNNDQQLISDLHASLQQAKGEYEKHLTLSKVHEYTLIVGAFCDHFPQCGFTPKVYEDNPLYKAYLKLKYQGRLDPLSEFLGKTIENAYLSDSLGSLPQKILPYYSGTHQRALDRFYPAGSSCSEAALDNLETLDPAVRPPQEWIERVKLWCDLIERVKKRVDIGHSEQD